MGWSKVIKLNNILCILNTIHCTEPYSLGAILTIEMQTVVVIEKRENRLLGNQNKECV